MGPFLHLLMMMAGVSGDADVAAWIRSQAGSAQVNAAGEVEEVSLGYTWITDSDMERVAALKKVRKLDLAMGQMGERGLALLREMRSVKELTLYHAEFVADVAMANLAGWKQLERLVVRGTDITDTSMAYIGGMTNLKALDISWTQITDNGLDHLGNLTQLEELALGGNKVSGSGMTMLRVLPKLRVLDVNGTQKRNSGMWMASIADFDLDMIGSLGSLEELNLGGTKVTDLGMEKLPRLKKLRRLDVSRTAVSGAGLAQLSGLPVERLSVWKSKKIGDDAAAQIAMLKGLKVLDIADTALTDRGLAALATLPLEQLFVSGTSVTAEGVERFRKEKPQCRVSWR